MIKVFVTKKKKKTDEDAEGERAVVEEGGCQWNLKWQIWDYHFVLKFK